MEQARQTRVESGPGSMPSMSGAVRTFMFGIATDQGPRLLAFRINSMLIGRLPDNHFAINHGSVSRRHARIIVSPSGMLVEDLESQNGTTINGVRVKKEHPLKPGDVLRIGHVPLFYFGFIRPDAPPAIDLVESAVAVNAAVAELM
jgi:pSer/pThr/pTyr-binding forkhead associated (FHA) protein